MAEQMMTAAEIAAEIERRENSPTLEQLKAAQAFHEFTASNPDWVECSENVDTLLTWMRKYAIRPSVGNYEQAFAACQAASLFIDEGESEDVPPEPEITLTLAELDAMPSDLYKQKLHDPKFAAAVEKLLETSRKARPQPIRR